jgi:hypothetical protein
MYPCIIVLVRPLTSIQESVGSCDSNTDPFCMGSIRFFHLSRIAINFPATCDLRPGDQLVVHVQGI